MQKSAAKSNKVFDLISLLVRIYIATALVVWKGIGLYIAGSEGFFSSFTASSSSLAIGGGYVLGIVILFGQAILQFKLKQYQGLTQTLIFAGLGLLFLFLGTVSSSSLKLSSIGSLVLLGINGLILCLFMPRAAKIQEPNLCLLVLGLRAQSRGWNRDEIE
jgi:hypothetical protein